MKNRLGSRAWLALAGSLLIPIAFASAQGSGGEAAPGEGVVIKKKAISSAATFIPYKAGGYDMEVIAVRAADGTIRTALNTCQICYRSGRGYYKQAGGFLVCQNCGNRFKVDEVERVKGGCNPIPILESDKSDLGDAILIPRAYLEKAAPYFAVWKKRG
jgi:hypothetical protein